VLEETKISVVVPTYQSSQHISEALASIAEQCSKIATTQIVLVDDGSLDDSFRTALETLRSLSEVSFVAVELAKNVGQTAATAIGMIHSLGDVVITMDDDLTYPPTEIPKLLAGLSEELDFVVGAPVTYGNSRPRSAASRVVRWMAVRTLGTPRDFVFSSFVAYRRSFLTRIDIPSCQIDDIGWAFKHTACFRNVSIHTSQGLRMKSNYHLRSLLSVARPVTRFLSPLISQIATWVSSVLIALTLALSTMVLFGFLTGTKFLPGFPTVVIAILFNIAISSMLLTLAVSILSELRRRRTSTAFRVQRRVVQQ
jgi:glycosyltransferase involved in cell wall biosynthesis